MARNATRWQAIALARTWSACWSFRQPGSVRYRALSGRCQDPPAKAAAHPGCPWSARPRRHRLTPSALLLRRRQEWWRRTRWFERAGAGPVDPGVAIRAWRRSTVGAQIAFPTTGLRPATVTTERPEQTHQTVEEAPRYAFDRTCTNRALVPGRGIVIPAGSRTGGGHGGFHAPAARRRTPQRYCNNDAMNPITAPFRHPPQPRPAHDFCID